MDGAAKTWDQRVVEVFSNPDNDPYIDDYITVLRQKLEGLSGTLRRSVTSGLILIALFELFLRGAIEKASFGPLELRDFSIARKVIPVMVAYLFYEASHITYEIRIVEKVYYAIFRLKRREWYDNDLDSIAILTAGLLGGLADTYESVGDPKRARFANRLSRTLRTILPYSYMAFVAYAIIVQFIQFGFIDPILWIATLAAIAFIGYGIYLLGSTPD
jgi:hypothetical protein